MTKIMTPVRAIVFPSSILLVSSEWIIQASTNFHIINTKAIPIRSGITILIKPSKNDTSSANVFGVEVGGIH